MRPTPLQREHCLNALRERRVDSARVTIDLTKDDADDQFVVDLVDRLGSEALVRPDAVHGATLMLDPRLAPSAQQIADALVSRLVCDRLR